MMEFETEVPFRSSRSEKFTAEQKWALLLEYDKCLDRGSKAAFCRRVGIWTGTPRQWARDRAEGTLKDPASLENVKMSKKSADRALAFEERQELESLRTQNRKLNDRLIQEQAAVEILGKAAALLESLTRSAEQTQPEPEPMPGRPEWLQGPDTSRLPQIPSKHSRGSGSR